MKAFRLVRGRNGVPPPAQNRISMARMPWAVPALSENTDQHPGSALAGALLAEEKIGRRAPSWKDTTEFSKAVSVCENAEELIPVYQTHTCGSYPTELGILLKKLWELEGKNKNHRKNVWEMLKKICYEVKVSMKNMPSRSIANSVFLLGKLGAADKMLLAKASSVVAGRVKANSTEFKVMELAQMALTCKDKGFVNKDMADAIKTNFVALPEDDINPRSCVNILACVSKVHLEDANFLEKLLTYLTKHATMLSPRQASTVAAAALKLPSEKVEGSIVTELLVAIQDTVCRQLRKNIHPLAAALLVRDLARAKVLTVEAYELLLSVMDSTQAETRGGVVKSVLKESEPALIELGLEVRM